MDAVVLDSQGLQAGQVAQAVRALMAFSGYLKNKIGINSVINALQNNAACDFPQIKEQMSGPEIS